MNTGLTGKDWCIVEMDKSLINLNEQINGLNLELDEAKGIVKDAFQVGFNEAMK